MSDIPTRMDRICAEISKWEPSDIHELKIRIQEEYNGAMIERVDIAGDD